MNVKLEMLLSLVYLNFHRCNWVLQLKYIPGCYGINDEESDSGKSNDTDSPTELWFCDACKIGVQPVSLFFFSNLKEIILLEKIGEKKLTACFDFLRLS